MLKMAAEVERELKKERWRYTHKVSKVKDRFILILKRKKKRKIEEWYVLVVTKEAR